MLARGSGQGQVGDRKWPRYGGASHDGNPLGLDSGGATNKFANCILYSGEFDIMLPPWETS